MLQYKVVDESTLDLLIKINDCSLFEQYRLVGGTALALIHGHRKSIDLDFFGPEKIDTSEMMQFFKSIGDIQEVRSSNKIDSLFLNNVKIDVVNYPYPWIDSVLKDEKIRIASSKEIAAMKIAAITNRGSKKDFYDLNKLLEIFSLQQILDFYTKKFTDSSVFFALKSIIYFDDAEDQEDPITFDLMSWNDVKANIIQAHFDFIRNSKVLD
jgi:predicted nucleotidyltransferase component of viral defense system